MGLHLHSSKPPSVDSIQVITFSLVFLAGIINYLDRASLSVSNTTVRSELGLTAAQMGGLLSAFSLAYGLAQLPSGPLLDRFGMRLVLGGAMSCWSLAQLLTGLIYDFRYFVVLRLGLGVAEAPIMPAGVKATNDWCAIEDRGKAMGVVNMSTTLGSTLAPPLLTIIMLAFGWRNMFRLLGAAGLFLAVVWFALIRDRDKVVLTVHENAHLNGERSVVRQDAVSLSEWKRLFQLRTVWGMMLGFGGINYTAWLYLAWLPGYLQTERHLGLASSGWIAAFPFLAGSLGMLVSGLVADHLARRGYDLLSSRKLLIIIGMIGSASCTLFVAYAATTASAVLVISMALFLIHFAGTSAWGLVQVATPPRMVATVGSIQNFGSFIFASFAPLVTGVILDYTHSFKIALVICSLVTFACAISYVVIVRRPIEEKCFSTAPGT